MGIDATIDDSATFKMDEALSSKIFCSVCTFILEDPVSLVCCGAHLCSKCCDDVRRSQYPNCPLCRKAYFMSTKGYLMASVLSTVRLVCENADCRASVPYDEYEAHKKSCQEWAEKECPECKKATSVKKSHEHLACLETLATKLTAAEEQIRELKKEIEEMKEEQPRRSKRIKIEPGTIYERKLFPKLHSDEKIEVAENGWSLRFKGSGNRRRPYRLWIWTNDGAVRFKAVAEEINIDNGDEKSSSTIKSEADGPYKEGIMFKCTEYFCFKSSSRNCRKNVHKG
ncbi:Oidioi.mRNA.OKI2018_I69.PAR.g10822.t1.cds [Oikopleura dioica]|uniref:Oidioi.mRNA.OKI2018_I69.PAR.g10822.t1.cds n=1 Tax=Oikopleura dioica TaxID=34765 RepID=A0ABN7RSK8_OIKDI|nr:Oidioi.mRNA.OKI2018_I69.PAR.g10822.t1.cds [Oikopleura dioica]